MPIIKFRLVDAQFDRGAALRVSTCGIGIAACCSSLAINHHPIIRSYRTTGVNEPSRASYRFAKARSLQQTWQYLSRVITRMHKLIVTVTAWASSPSSPRPSRPQHAAPRIDIKILGRAKRPAAYLAFKGTVHI